MRRTPLIAAAVVLLAATSAHAATRSITNENSTWVPAQFHADAGDTISWTISSGTHNVVSYAGDGANFASPNLTAQSGAYTQPFAGGQKWYRCTFHSALGPGGACNGHCGSYSSRLVAPNAPSISTPAPGATVESNPYTVAGSAEPWMLIVVLQGSTEIGRAHANASGVWSTSVTSPASGSVTISARALDAELRASPNAAPVTFTLDANAPDVRPPTIRVTTPSPSAFLINDPVIFGTAWDDRSVSSVRLEVYNVAGQPAGVYPAACPCPSDPNVTVDWGGRLEGIMPGVYSIIATAVDSAGHVARSQPITIVFV